MSTEVKISKKLDVDGIISKKENRVTKKPYIKKDGQQPYKKSYNKNYENSSENKSKQPYFKKNDNEIKENVTIDPKRKEYLEKRKNNIKKVYEQKRGPRQKKQREIEHGYKPFEEFCTKWLEDHKK